MTIIDYRGNLQSVSIASNGGELTNTHSAALATALARASNGCWSKHGVSNQTLVATNDLIFFDEAEASAENVIVIVLQHDTNHLLDQEVLIPAFDASMLLDDMRTPDVSNAQLAAVASAALDIANEDGNTPVVPVYHTWRAFTSTRRIRSARVKALNLPAPVEPVLLDVPPDAPGA